MHKSRRSIHAGLGALRCVRWVLPVLVLLSISTGATADLTPGAGWAVLRVEFDGSATVSVTSLPPNGDLGLGIAAMNEQFQRVSSQYMTAAVAFTETWVDVDAAGLSKTIALAQTTSNSFSVVTHVSGTPDVLYFVVFAAGRPGSWDYAVEGSVYTEVARGTKTFYSDGSDFDGGIEVANQLSTTRVAVATDRTYDLQISGDFFGPIGAGSSSFNKEIENITIVGPDFERQCPCNFDTFGGARGLGAGTYEIRRDSIQVNALAYDHVFFGADVLFPR